MKRKEAILEICAYCEASKEEILASGKAKTDEDALRFVLIGEDTVLLCPDCREKYAAYVDDEMDELLNGPVTFPPGVTAVEHVCPELEFQGKNELEATSILEMVRDGDYYVATCPHCEVTVRSLADDEP